MVSGWRYRVASISGAVAISALAVAVANHPASQRVLSMLPVVGRLPQTTLSPPTLIPMLALAVVVVVGVAFPLFKPRPRRVLDTVVETGRRVLVATTGMAAVGYFDYTFRLPRSTLVATTALLAVALPAWFLFIRRRPQASAERAIVVGDDRPEIETILQTTDLPIIGYVSPPTDRGRGRGEMPVSMTDGGELLSPSEEYTRLSELECLGGLSRLDDILVEYDVDTAVLAFTWPDRQEFFGTLETCYEHGVSTKVHREFADSVLTSGVGSDELVDIDLQPWDWQEHVVKRTFDVTFAAAALLAFAPLMFVIAVAIRAEDGGPVLYSQHRTAALGDTFRVYKFRTMVPEGEDATPVDDDANDRITRVGRVLRRTHLDELPQLWSILVGRMSVVGPRAAWTEEETHLEDEADAWRKRWFVKPGLTGLAQINEATSTDPQTKLRYDIEYIRRQSFWFDLKIVVRQVWLVLVELASMVRGRLGRSSRASEQ